MRVSGWLPRKVGAGVDWLGYLFRASLWLDMTWFGCVAERREGKRDKSRGPWESDG